MLELRPSFIEEAAKFVAFEQTAETSEFIIPYTLEQHKAEFSNKHRLYLSILQNGELVGFFILATDVEGDIEFRRVVVNAKGQGIGQQSIQLMEQYCKQHLAAKRIWLDVFFF